MVNCDLCKSNYYSDDDPDTVCESKCKKMKSKEYTTEMMLEDIKIRVCRFFEEADKS